MTTLTHPLQRSSEKDHDRRLRRLSQLVSWCFKPSQPPLEDHEGSVSIGGRTITNLRFADDIDGLAGEEEELAKLVERLDKGATAFGMEIIAEKTKLKTNNTSGIGTEIKVNRQKLETITSFKYLC